MDIDLETLEQIIQEEKEGGEGRKEKIYK